MNRRITACTKIGQVMIGRSNTVDVLTYTPTDVFNTPYRGIILLIDRIHDPLWWCVFFNILATTE